MGKPVLHTSVDNELLPIDRLGARLFCSLGLLSPQHLFNHPAYTEICEIVVVVPEPM